MASVKIYFRDHGNQLVSTGIPVQTIATQTEKEDIRNALIKWSIGEDDGADEINDMFPRIGVGATSPLAQSGVYAYIVMRDNITGDDYRERIPMPDLAKGTDLSGNTAWLSETDSAGKSTTVGNPLHADYQELKDALEASYLSPNGNTAQLTRIYVPNKL